MKVATFSTMFFFQQHLMTIATKRKSTHFPVHPVHQHSLLVRLRAKKKAPGPRATRVEPLPRPPPSAPSAN